MTDHKALRSIPKSFTLREASDILDKTKLLLAPSLPGCTPRRFDYPIFNGWSHIELCFASSGPIVPKLLLSPDSYLCIATLFFGYSSFLRDKMNVGYEFSGPNIYTGERLDAGPEAIAAIVKKRLAAFDLSGAVAAGTPERILADQPRTDISEDLLELSLCAIYLRKYQEAQTLLQDCVQSAEQDGRPRYLRAGNTGKIYLAKLSADADALRETLIATMNEHWSHFKVVEAER
jgi:hypothetical protein